MNKTKLIILISLSALLIIFSEIVNYRNKQINEIKKELIQTKNKLKDAEKPSKIEIQKQELEKLSKQLQEAEKFCQNKSNIEEKIQNKKNEILGISKK